MNLKDEKIKSLDYLVNKLQSRHPDFSNISKFCLFLGAGCSRKSGIPTASEIITNLKKLWFLDNFPKGSNFKKGDYEFDENFFTENNDSFEESVINEELKLVDDINSDKNNLLEKLPPSLLTKTPEDEILKNIFYDQLYGFWFKRFSENPKDRQKFIESLIEKSVPHGAYILLSHLMSNNLFFSNIFTTNFDDLVNDSLIKYTDKKPRVYAHNEIAKYINVFSSRPNIIKLHGDFLFENIKNIPDETRSLWGNMAVKLREALNTLDIVVIGYNGADESIMTALTDLKKEHTYGLYWCAKEYATINWRAKALIADNVNSFFVPTESFEFFVYKLYDSVKDKVDIPNLIENSNITQNEFDQYVSDFGTELESSKDLEDNQKEGIKESLELILNRNSFHKIVDLNDLQEKIEYLKKMRIDGIARVLKNIHETISMEEAKLLYAEIFNWPLLVDKLAEAPIAHISNALSNLNVIDSVRTQNLLDNLTNEVIARKLDEAKDSDVYSALGELGAISPEKIREIRAFRKIEYDSDSLNEFDLRTLTFKLKTASKESAIEFVRTEEERIIEKLKIESVKEITLFLESLKNISPLLARHIFMLVDESIIRERIEKENVNQIGITLNLFTKLDKNRTFKICETLDFEQLAKKAEILELREIQNGLREIDVSNSYLAYQLYHRLSNEMMKNKYLRSDIQTIGVASDNLMKIDSEKTKQVLNLLEDSFYISLFNNSACTYQQFATALQKLAYIDFKRFSSLLRRSNTELIASRLAATMNKTGEQVFFHFFPILYKLDWNLTHLLIGKLSGEQIVNLLKWDKIDLYAVNLRSLKAAFEYNKMVDEANLIEKILEKNKYRFDKYLNRRNKRSSLS